ncbi:MAG: AAA family ATPase [Actinomycetota bacterium]|nr:AAA family ATPase [Actinomycetota bacterium]
MTARVVERRIVTVLFADLVGFTSLSERLDAEDVSLIQDAYFDAVRETIERHGGMLEKFVGDAAMAVFGAPRVRDDDAERAVRAGLALVAAIGRIGSTLGLDEGALRLRVGVNTGEAVYGEATADRGPVTGDTVNVAARLQAAAEPGTVVVGEVTALAVADAIETDRLGDLELKGKGEAVPAWRVIGAYPERSRERALGGLSAAMIGRDAELRQLLASLDNGAERIVVVAPPGVGKTRLLEEFGTEAAHSGARVFRARLRPDLLSPFEPVGQLVRSVGEPTEVLARIPGARGEVVRASLMAVIAPVDATPGPAEDRDRLFAAWLEGLDALTAGDPAAWLVEDLHWASGDLLAFLDFATRAPAPTGRLIVGTTRPSLLESAAHWCQDSAVLHLAPLPAAQTAELIRGLVGDVLPDELVERIADRSGGNALFVEELLRTWVSTGVLTQNDTGAWTLVVDAQDVALPPTVQAIYAGQLDDLPPSARTAARRASVAGRRFPFAALQPLNVDDPEEAVGVLERRALVAGAADDPILGASYVYRHALLRDAGYASLARGERASLHVQLAQWLAGLQADALPTLAEVIARHYAAAVDSAPSLARDIGGRSRDEVRATAAEWFERASEVASRFAAWESARTLARRALDLSEKEQPLVRARRLELLAHVTANAAGLEEAKEHLREALELHRAEGSRSGLASAGAALGRLLWAQTRFEESEKLADALLEEIGGPEDICWARLLLTRASGVLGAWDAYDRAEADATRALSLARAAADEGLELEALRLTVVIQLERGDGDTGALAAVEELAKKVGQWETVAFAVRARAGGILDDQPEAALTLFERAAEVAVAYGLTESAGWSDYSRAEAYFCMGRWDDAIDAGLRAVALGEEHEFFRLVVRSWFVLLPLARARGRDDLIRQAHPYFVSRLGRAPDSQYSRVVATAAHLHFAAIGLEPRFIPDVEERLASFDLDHAGPSWLAAVETLVEVWLSSGDDGAAALALDRMRARLDRDGATALARSTEALLRARLMLTRAEDVEATAAAERALAELGDRAPWWRAKAIRVLEQAGAAGADLLEDARKIEASLGIPSAGVAA